MRGVLGGHLRNGDSGERLGMLRLRSGTLLERAWSNGGGGLLCVLDRESVFLQTSKLGKQGGERERERASFFIAIIIGDQNQLLGSSFRGITVPDPVLLGDPLDTVIVLD